VIDKNHEQPISIGRVGKFGALDCVVGACSARERAERTSARALGGARTAHAAFGAGVLVAICLLRGGVAHERRLGWATGGGCTGVSTVS